MIGYTCVGTNNKPRAMAFYDALLGLLGAKRFYETERGVGWGVSAEQPMFAVNTPFDGALASVGNGSMVALSAASADQVQALYAKALERERCTDLGHRMACCLQLVCAFSQTKHRDCRA